MKIAHVQVPPKLSGAQNVSLDILSSLNNECNELYMICSAGENAESDFFDTFGLCCTNLSVKAFSAI